MNDVLVSVDYVMQVYDELFAFLKKELSQYIAKPELTPLGFDIQFKKIIDVGVKIKFKLLNGSLNSKIDALHIKGYTSLDYTFEIYENEVVASGSFKVKVWKKANE